MRSKVFIVEGFNKLLDLPEGVDPSWPVYNAPRPLYGTETWQDDFRHGIFYAAIDPDDLDAELMLNNTLANVGHLVVHVTDEEVEAYAEKLSDELMIDRKDYDREMFIRSMIHGLIQEDEESLNERQGERD